MTKRRHLSDRSRTEMFVKSAMGTFGKCQPAGGPLVKKRELNLGYDVKRELHHQALNNGRIEVVRDSPPSQVMKPPSTGVAHRSRQ